MALAEVSSDNGGTYEPLRTPAKFVPLSAVSVTTIAALWTPAVGKRVRLLGGSISVSAAGSLLLEDNAAGAGNFLWRTPVLTPDTPYNFDLGAKGQLLAAADRVVKGTLAGATVTGTLYGCEE